MVLHIMSKNSHSNLLNWFGFRTYNLKHITFVCHASCAMYNVQCSVCISNSIRICWNNNIWKCCPDLYIYFASHIILQAIQRTLYGYEMNVARCENGNDNGNVNGNANDMQSSKIVGYENEMTFLFGANNLVWWMLWIIILLSFAIFTDTLSLVERTKHPKKKDKTLTTVSFCPQHCIFSFRISVKPNTKLNFNLNTKWMQTKCV